MSSNYEKALAGGVPSVHLNGTGRQELEAQYRRQHEAVEAAIRALSEAAPHPRDYYVQPAKYAFTAAQAKHQSRLRRLVEIKNEIEDDYQVFSFANQEESHV